MPELHCIFDVPDSSPPTLQFIRCDSNHALGITFAFRTGRGAGGKLPPSQPSLKDFS